METTGIMFSDTREDIEKIKLGDEELKIFCLKYLGGMQSRDGDSLVPIRHRIEIAWL